MTKYITLAIKMEGSDQAEAKVEQIASAFDDVKDSADGAEKEVAQISSAFSRLDKAAISALKQIKDHLQAVGSKLQSIGKDVRQVGVGMTATLTVTLTLLASQILGIGTTYEASMNMLQATTKATAQEMSLAAQKAKELGADMSLPATSAGDAALAMTELAKAGMNVQESMDAAQGTLRLAAAGQLEEAKAAEITANALNAFKLKASDAVVVSDLLAAAANASSAEVSDVAESFQQASAVFASAKVPIQDLTTAIVLMANSGIKGSDAGTSLKTFLERLQAPTDNAADAMKALGLRVFDAKGQLRPLVDIVEDFHGALGKLTDEQKAQTLQTIFGSDATRAAAILFRDGTKAFMEAKTAITQEGAAAELAAAKTKGLGGAWAGLKSQLETLGIAIYEKVSAPLEGVTRLVADNVGQFANWFQTFADANPEIVQLGVAFLALLAVLGPILVVVGSLIVAVGGVVAAIGSIAGAIGAAAAAVGGFAPLLGIAAAAVVALTAYIVLLAEPVVALYVAWQTNFGGIRDYTIQVWAVIKQVTQKAWSEISALVKQLGGDVVTWFRDNYPLIQQTVQNVSNYIKSGLAVWGAAILAFWKQHGEQIKFVVSGIWNIVKTTVSTGLHIVLDLIKAAMQIINGDWSGAWITFVGIVARAITATWTNIKQAASIFFSNALYAGQQIIEGIVNGISSGLGKVKTAIGTVVDIVRTTPMLGWIMRSPSRLFMQYGRDLLAGLIIGLASMTPQVEAQMSRIVELVKRDFSTSRERRASDSNITTVQEIRGLVDGFGEIAAIGQPVETNLQRINRLLKDPDVIEFLKQRGLWTVAYTTRLIQFAKVLDHIAERDPAKFGLNETRQRIFISPEHDPNASGLTEKRDRVFGVDLAALKTLREDLNNKLKDAIQLTERQRIEELLLTDAYKGLTEAERNELRTLADQVDLRNVTLEEARRVREELENLAAGITNVFGNALDNLLKGDLQGFWQSLKQGFAQLFRDIVSDFILSGLHKIIRQLLGLDTPKSGQQTSGGGGILNTILGSVFGGLFGRGGESASSSSATSAAQSTAANVGKSFAHSSSIGREISEATLSIHRASLPSPETIIGHEAAAHASGRTLASTGATAAAASLPQKLSFGKFLGGLAPMLGASLGGLVGGQSAIGSLLGMAGGLLGGLVFGASTGAIGGSLGSLFALSGALGPIALAAAPLLLIGGWLLGKAKARKIDETKRDKLFGDAVSQMRQVLQQVQTHNLDGSEAKARAGQIYNEWYEQVQQIKTKSVKKSALQNQQPVLRNIMAQIDAAAAQAGSELALAARFAPEFATGVFIGSDNQMADMRAMLTARRNGLLPGIFDGRDNIPAWLSRGEMVLNPTQQNRVRSLAGWDVFADAGIPNYPTKPSRPRTPRFAEGAFIGSVTPTPTQSPQADGDINITITNRIDAKGMVETNIQTDSGRRIVAKVTNEAIDRGEINIP